MNLLSTIMFLLYYSAALAASEVNTLLFYMILIVCVYKMKTCIMCMTYVNCTLNKTYIIVYDIRDYDERVLMWNSPPGGSGRTETGEGMAGEMRPTCE